MNIIIISFDDEVFKTMIMLNLNYNVLCKSDGSTTLWRDNENLQCNAQIRMKRDAAFRIIRLSEMNRSGVRRLVCQEPPLSFNNDNDNVGDGVFNSVWNNIRRWEEHRWNPHHKQIQNTVDTVRATVFRETDTISRNTTTTTQNIMNTVNMTLRCVPCNE
mgnify:CR=1 FL=1